MDLQRIDSVMSSIPQELAIILKWRDIVGEQIAKICIPSSVKNSTLTIHAKNSTWVYELNFHKTTIIQKVNNFLREPINKIKIKPTPYIKNTKQVKPKNTDTLPVPKIDLNNPYVEASTIYIKDEKLKKIAQDLVWKAVCVTNRTK